MYVLNYGILKDKNFIIFLNCVKRFYFEVKEI